MLFFPPEEQMNEERQAWGESQALYCNVKYPALAALTFQQGWDIHTSHILTMAKARKWDSKGAGFHLGWWGSKPETRTSEITMNTVYDKGQLSGWENQLSSIPPAQGPN